MAIYPWKLRELFIVIYQPEINKFEIGGPMIKYTSIVENVQPGQI